MASSFSDLGIELMATGENAGTWGTKTNTNLQIVEKAIAGYVEQAVTSGGTTALSITDGDATESTSVARHAVIKLTGTITGNSIVTVPDSIEKVYIVTNGTSGAYTVQFKTASGTGITFGVSEKTTRLVYSDGTNLVDAGFGGSLDIEGRELVLDADGDTTITADTDDQIDIKIAGADDFQFTANTFTAQSGSTIAAQALTATTITASGIVKTDDTTDASSTTDGSLQTDGGLSVAKDAVIGDDLKLLSDSSILSFGADSDTTLTHTDGTGLTLNSANKLTFRDTGLTIGSNADGDLDIVSDGTAVDSINIESAGGITLDAGTAGSGIIYEDDGTEMARIHNSSSDVILETKVSDKDFLIKGNDGGSTITALTLDMSAAGAATFNDKIVATELDISGDVDIDGTLETDALSIASTTITTTAAEINLIDGGTSRGTTAVADGDGLLVNDDGTMRMTNVTTLKTYFQTGISSAADDISAGDGAINLTTSSGNITIDAAANDSDIIFKGTDNSSDITMLTLDGSDAGSASFNDKVTIGDGKLVLNSTAVTSTAAELNLLDGVSGLVQADFTKLAAVDSTAAELNIVDGGTSATSTTVADADRVVLNDNGTMVQVAVTDLAAYFDDEITAMPNLTSVGTLTTLTVDNIIINGTTIGHTDDTDLITIADGIATVAGEISVTTLDIGGTNITSTAAELNLLDGGTSVGSSITIADSDGVVVNDGGTMKSVPASDFKTLVGAAAGAFSIANLDIDGGTDIGEAIVDADLFIVDNGAGGTNRKVAASRLVTYIDANSSAASVGKAIAMAIVFG